MTKEYKLELFLTNRSAWLDGKKINPRRSQIIYNHSPDGFMWGYGGSGPAQLALAILLELIPADKARQHYQEFKTKLITTLDMDKSHEIRFKLEDYIKLNLIYETG